MSTLNVKFLLTNPALKVSSKEFFTDKANEVGRSSRLVLLGTFTVKDWAYLLIHLCETMFSFLNILLVDNFRSLGCLNLGI